MINAPVFIIDDDTEELDIVQEIWESLPFTNALETFDNPEKLIARLSEERINPFIIICDVNLPKMDGFELREKLASENQSRYKSIPFAFWSTSASNEQIKKAYDSGGHGFFMKGSTFEEIKDSLNAIMIYWKRSKVPEVSR